MGVDRVHALHSYARQRIRYSFMAFGAGKKHTACQRQSNERSLRQQTTTEKRRLAGQRTGSNERDACQPSVGQTKHLRTRGLGCNIPVTQDQPQSPAAEDMVRRLMGVTVNQSGGIGLTQPLVRHRLVSVSKLAARLLGRLTLRAHPFSHSLPLDQGLTQKIGLPSRAAHQCAKRLVGHIVQAQRIAVRE